LTFITQPKKEGACTNCPECKTELIGRLTDYKGKYADKLQWQDKDSRKAHYDKDGNCKGSVDGFEGDVTTQESTEETTTVDLSTLDKFDANAIKNTAITLWHIRMRVESTIKALEVKPNGGMIWEMTKIIYSELYGDKKQ